MAEFEKVFEEDKMIFEDENGDGIHDIAYVDSTGDGIVDKTVDLHGKSTQASTEKLDTTGDGNVDTIAIDTTGDGQYDTLLTDTTGDGQMDTAFVDSTGDGVLNDTVDLK